MKRSKTVVASAILAGSAVVSGCATPTVVSEKEVGDSQMTCAQIEREIREVERIKSEAERDKGVSGKNVAAFLFFWPAIIGNEYNTTKAIEAANKRLSYLAELHEQKGCSG